MQYLRVFDLDGCLYDYNALPDYGFYKLCDEANALSARTVFPELAYEKACELAALSFKNHHDCYGGFTDYAISVGHDPIEVRKSIFGLYHSTLFDLLDERHPDFFDHVAPTVEAFAKEPAIFANAILSHSCMAGWGKPILRKMGLIEYFEPHLLFGMNDYGFERKFENAIAMQKMVDASGYAPDRIIFIEDSWRNARPSFERLGIPIALIHYSAQTPDPQLAGVRWVCRTPADLSQTLAKEFATQTEISFGAASIEQGKAGLRHKLFRQAQAPIESLGQSG